MKTISFHSKKLKLVPQILTATLKYCCEQSATAVIIYDYINLRLEIFCSSLLWNYCSISAARAGSTLSLPPLIFLAHFVSQKI